MWWLPATIPVEYETKHIRKIVDSVKRSGSVVVKKPKPWVQLNQKPAWLGRRK